MSAKNDIKKSTSRDDQRAARKLAKERGISYQAALQEVRKTKTLIHGEKTTDYERRRGVIPTGAISLDMALGIGGVPRGRIVEVFGPGQSGKTTILYHVLAEGQKLGAVCAIIDAERSINATYAKAIGVDMEKLLVFQPEDGEQAFETIDWLIEAGGVDVIAIDAIEWLTPRGESEGDDPLHRAQKRMLSKGIKKLQKDINRTEMACIITSQIQKREDSPEPFIGGHAVKFYASQRIELKSRSRVKISGPEIVGSHVRAKVVKNRLVESLGQAEFDMESQKGILSLDSLLDTALEWKVIFQTGLMYYYGDRRLGPGRQKAKQEIKDDLALERKITEELYERLGVNRVNIAQFSRDNKPLVSPVFSPKGGVGKQALHLGGVSERDIQVFRKYSDLWQRTVRGPEEDGKAEG